MYFNADALVTNKGLRLEIEPGNNEGCYITLYEGAMWIMSWRYACYNPKGREIRAEYNRIKSALKIGTN